MTTGSPTFGIAPAAQADWIRAALRVAGGQEAAPAEAVALLWGGRDVGERGELLQEAPNLRWVQLPSAGVESYHELIDARRVWTAARSVFSESVAEYALGLALAGLRHICLGARTHSWRKGPAATLFGARVSILGGGTIPRAVVKLLAPFRVQATVVRQHPGTLEGAERVLGSDELEEALPGAALVVVALPLTKATAGIIAAPQLRSMDEGSWLVNVARGKLVVTDDLVRALSEHRIGGAALDVTDPEPVPDEHPLWGLDNCIISSHNANPPNLERPQMAARITDNIRRYLRHEPLLGVVDPQISY